MVSQLQGMLDFDRDALAETILVSFPRQTPSKLTATASDDDTAMIEALWNSAKTKESLTWFWTVCDICYRRPAGYPIRKGPHLRVYEGICAVFAAPYRLLHSKSQETVPEATLPPFVQQLHPLVKTVLRRPSYWKTWWNLQDRSPDTHDGEIAQMNALETDIWKRVGLQSWRENEDEAKAGGNVLA